MVQGRSQETVVVTNGSRDRDGTVDTLCAVPSDPCPHYSSRENSRNRGVLRMTCCMDAAHVRGGREGPGVVVEGHGRDHAAVVASRANLTIVTRVCDPFVRSSLVLWSGSRVISPRTRPADEGAVYAGHVRRRRSRVRCRRKQSSSAATQSDPTYVCISLDGHLDATGSLNTVVCIWDVATGQPSLRSSSPRLQLA